MPNREWYSNPLTGVQKVSYVGSLSKHVPMSSDQTGLTPVMNADPRHHGGNRPGHLSNPSSKLSYLFEQLGLNRGQGRNYQMSDRTRPIAPNYERNIAGFSISGPKTTEMAFEPFGASTLNLARLSDYQGEDFPRIVRSLAVRHQLLAVHQGFGFTRAFCFSFAISSSTSLTNNL